jgi:CubicO group peptidase (beta-lactamase class C family)
VGLIAAALAVVVLVWSGLARDSRPVTKPAEQWVVRDGLGAGQFGVEDRRLAANGYRVSSVSAYAIDGEIDYAALWNRTAGLPRRARVGLNTAQYRRTVHAMTADGYRPIQVDAHTVAGSTRFAAIFQQDTTHWVARTGLTAGQLDAESDRWTERGYRMRDLSGYSQDGGARYAAVWERLADRPQRTVHDLDAAEYESALDSLASAGYGPIDVSVFRVGRETRHAAIFAAGGVQPWEERHDLDADAYRQAGEDLRLQGYRPVTINAHAGASGTRFALVWRNPLFSASELRRIDAVVGEAMGRTSTVGLSLAITHRGRLVFAKAYGSESPSSRVPLHTSSRFRIASVSKSMTALEIMHLVEQGRLELGQRVFGPGALLGERYGPMAGYADPRVKDITVEQLLEHTAGGWENDSSDGTADPLSLHPELSRDDLIAWTLRNVALEASPGTAFDYSNFGYALLGRIIERVTGRPYAEVMRDDVFGPAGARSFALGHQSAAERLPGEVRYTQLGASVDRSYTIPMERHDSVGAWIATPVDLLRVVAQYDGFATVPDRLKASTLETMTTPTEQRTPDGRRAYYAKGWMVNDIPNWWHTGRLPGASALLVRTANRYGATGREEFTWSALTNSNHAQPEFDLDLDALMWQVLASVRTWPDQDLF